MHPWHPSNTPRLRLEKMCDRTADYYTPATTFCSPQIATTRPELLSLILLPVPLDSFRVALFPASSIDHKLMEGGIP